LRENGEAADEPPKLSFGAVGAGAGAGAGAAGFGPPKTLNDPDPEEEPNRLVFPAPARAKGDAVDDASLANPELAKAEADVCDLSPLVPVAEVVEPLASDDLSRLDLEEVLDSCTEHC
jgi:hypothetical protein